MSNAIADAIRKLQRLRVPASIRLDRRVTPEDLIVRRNLVQEVAQICDSVIAAVASEAAKFTTPGVTWGFFCSTPGVAVGRNLLRKRAMEMLLTGDVIGPQQALEWGLVNRVVPVDQLDAEVEKLARQIADKPPATVAAGKRAFYQQMDLGIARAYDLASGVISSSFAHPEGKEGMDAFIDKRPPNWK